MSATHRFIVETGPGAGGSFAIGPEGGGIGRQAGNALRLDDPYLAPFHARLDWHQGYLYVTDLGSGAGTRVNGQAITASAPLSPGDTVDVGATRLRFDTGATPGAGLPMAGAAPIGAVPAGPAAARVRSRSTKTWWLIGGGIAAVLLCCVVSIAVFVAVVVRGTSGPRDAATNYYKALGAHDWAEAATYLAAPASNAADQQRVAWTSLESQYGAFKSSSVSSTNIVNSTAKVSGTLKFTKKSIPFSLDLVKLDGAWKITSRR